MAFFQIIQPKTPNFHGVSGKEPETVAVEQAVGEAPPVGVFQSAYQAPQEVLGIVWNVQQRLGFLQAFHDQVIIVQQFLHADNVRMLKIAKLAG